MQEPTLHGWRLADGTATCACPAIRRGCAPYHGAAGGKLLATSGSEQWSSGPSPARTARWASSRACWRQLEVRVTAVACHPTQEIVAAGFENGIVLMVRLGNGAKLLVRHDGGGPVAALAWNAKGTTLAFAVQNGDAGLVDL